MDKFAEPERSSAYEVCQYVVCVDDSFFGVDRAERSGTKRSRARQAVGHWFNPHLLFFSSLRLSVPLQSSFLISLKAGCVKFAASVSPRFVCREFVPHQLLSGQLR